MENTAASPIIYVVETSTDPLVYSYEFHSAYSTREGAEDRASRLGDIGKIAIVTTAVLH
jgi:hypothetical protein